MLNKEAVANELKLLLENNTDFVNETVGYWEQYADVTDRDERINKVMYHISSRYYRMKFDITGLAREYVGECDEFDIIVTASPDEDFLRRLVCDTIERVE